MQVKNDKEIEAWMMKQNKKIKSKEEEVFNATNRKNEINHGIKIEHKRIKELRMEKK